MKVTFSRSQRIAAVVLAIVLVVAVGTGVALAPLYDIPVQPIPFSHRIHVESKQISCFFCHHTAARSSNAAIPSVDKCLLCHSVVATQFPPIRRITEYYDRGEPIPWVRVNKVPEFVRFSHQPHITQRTDCGKCHGNVRAMDRVRQPNHAFSMNFCVNCHWERNAPSDCTTCHY